jgi:archaellum biogenesis ATPase FlaH
LNIRDGRLTAEEIKKNTAAIDHVVVKSNLECFQLSNGLRPGMLSIFLGPKGNGKSALCKTVSLDCMRSRVKCLHILSEEESSLYKRKIAESAEKYMGDKADELLQYLLFDSMLEWTQGQLTKSGFMKRLQDLINEYLPEVILFDNLTTSFLSSLHISQQGAVIADLRRIAKESETIIVLVAHTAKSSDPYQKMLTGEDVRGTAETTNTSAYNYVLTTFFRLDKPRAFLFVDKARYHPQVNSTYWELFYDQELGIYLKSEKRSYQEVREVMAETSKGVPVKVYKDEIERLQQIIAGGNYGKKN